MSSLDNSGRGRKPRPEIELMQTKAWLAQVKRVSGCATAYELIRTWEEGTTTITAPRFDRYEHGRFSPSHSARRAVEQVFPGTIAVFDHGPGATLSLWEVLAGPIEACWVACISNCPNLERMRRAGAPQHAKVEELSRAVLGFEPRADDLNAWAHGETPNLVAIALANVVPSTHIGSAVIDLKGTLLTIDGVTALVAMHRLCLFFGSASVLTGYLLDGLEKLAIPVLFDPYSIAGDLTAWLRRMDLIDLAKYSHLVELRRQSAAGDTALQGH